MTTFRLPYIQTFADRHGKPAADNISQHIIDNDIAAEGPELLKDLEGCDDPPTGTPDTGFGPAGLHAPHAVVAFELDIRKGDFCIAPLPYKVHDRGNEPAVHEHAGAVPLGITANLEDIQPPF